MTAGRMEPLGESAEVLAWAEKITRANRIAAAWMASAAAQGVEIELPAMPIRPIPQPSIAESERILSDAADDDLTLPP